MSINQDDRLTQLRKGELVGSLTQAEQEELATLLHSLETDEEVVLNTAVSKMLSEQIMLQSRLDKLQNDNEALANLLNQQEQLAAEARQWLHEFGRRHQRIQQAYTRITGEALSGG